MKALVIGYGSIGMRHARLLLERNDVSEVHVVSSRYDELKTDKTLFFKDFEGLNPADYCLAVVASITSDHEIHLNRLRKFCAELPILVEKPLFTHYQKPQGDMEKVFVAYQLRMHPLVQTLRRELVSPVLLARFEVGQNIKGWNEHRSYQEMYRSKKELGGGVLRDLSHEIDLALYLLGDFRINFSRTGKLGSFDLDCENYAIVESTLKDSGSLLISLDSIHHRPFRKIRITTESRSFDLDLVLGKLIITDFSGKQMEYESEPGLDHSMKKQYEAILAGKTGDLCDYEQGLKVLGKICEIEDKFTDTNLVSTS